MAPGSSVYWHRKDFDFNVNAASKPSDLNIVAAHHSRPSLVGVVVPEILHY